MGGSVLMLSTQTEDVGAIPAAMPIAGDHICKPRLSAELFVIDLDQDRFLIYAPLRKTAFVGNAGAINLIRSISDTGSVDSADDPDGSFVEFLRRLRIIDAEPETRPDLRFEGDPQPTSLTLLLTTACNLRCTYCYASAGDTPAQYMSLETAKRGIDFVVRNAAERGISPVEITFHGGGEPTAHWQVMTGALEYTRKKAAEHDVELRAFVGTNGVLGEANLDWIVANLSGASLSFDGLPDEHDRNRLTVLGRGSSEQVMHTMRRFDESRFSYGIRMTATAEQVHRLPDSVEFICRNFKPSAIQVEPAYSMGRGSGSPGPGAEEFLVAFREAKARAAVFERTLLFGPVRVGALTNHFCGVSRDSFVLSPNGNVTACYEVFSESAPFADRFFYGEPAPGPDGYRFRMEVLDGLRRHRVENLEFCRGCFARWTCAGDCFHKGLFASGGDEFRGTDRCRVTQELTKDELLARIAQAGGAYWCGQDDVSERSSADGAET